MKSFSILRTLRVVRFIRMVRLLKVFQELWLIVKGIVDSVRTIFWASLLLFCVLYVSGIAATHMIGQNTEAYSPDWVETAYGRADDPDEFNNYRYYCLLYTSPSPRDQRGSRMPSSA